MMQTQSVCPTCEGEGTIIKNKCHVCNGNGVVKGEEVVEINIPAGVSEGMIVNVPGKEMRADATELPATFRFILKKNPTTLLYVMTTISSTTSSWIFRQQH